MTNPAEDSGPAVPAERITYALRRMRANCYRVEATVEGTFVSLIMQASPAGRRNAATHIVELLERHGLALDAEDAVAELGRDGTRLRVRPHPA